MNPRLPLISVIVLGLAAIALFAYAISQNNAISASISPGLFTPGATFSISPQKP